MIDSTNGKNMIVKSVLEIRVEQLEAENAELQATLSLIYEADRRATEQWQTATGKTLVWPGKKELCVWLMEQNRDLQKDKELVKFLEGILDGGGWFEFEAGTDGEEKPFVRLARQGNPALVADTFRAAIDAARKEGV